MPPLRAPSGIENDAIVQMQRLHARMLWTQETMSYKVASAFHADGPERMRAFVSRARAKHGNAQVRGGQGQVEGSSAGVGVGALGAGWGRRLAILLELRLTARL